MKRVVAASVCFLPALVSAEAVQVHFWPTNVPAPATVVVDAHPCGSVLILQTDHVPQKPWLQADTVSQLDASGAVVKRWRVPVDLYPVGLDGDKVVMAFGSEPDSTLRVGVDGTIEVAKGAPTTFPKHAACPRLQANRACVVVSENPIIFLQYSPVCT